MAGTRIYCQLRHQARCRSAHAHLRTHLVSCTSPVGRRQVSPHPVHKSGPECRTDRRRHHADRAAGCTCPTGREIHQEIAYQLGNSSLAGMEKKDRPHPQGSRTPQGTAYSHRQSQDLTYSRRFHEGMGSGRQQEYPEGSSDPIYRANWDSYPPRSPSRMPALLGRMCIPLEQSGL